MNMPPRPRGSLPFPGLRWRGLNLQFFTFFFLPLIGVLLLVTFGSLRLHQRAMRQLVGERDERVARTAAAAIGAQLDHRLAAIRGLGLRAADALPPASVLAGSDFLADDFDGGLALYAPDGSLLAATNTRGYWTKPPAALSALLSQVQERPGENTRFSPLTITTEGESLVFVAFAASSDVPTAVGAFSPALIARRTLSGAFSPSEGATAFIVASDGEIIYQIGTTAGPGEIRQHPGVVTALRGESGTTYLDVNGDEHVVAFSPISPTGWVLVIEEPWASVSNPLLNTTQLAPLVLVPVLLLALLALWFGARQIVQPLQDLEARAAQLAWGDYRSIQEDVGGIEEIQRLQRTLIHLAEKIQRSQEGLRGYIGAITAGQEEERRRLARELHDDTIQALIALNQRVQLAQLKLEPDCEGDASLEEIHRLTENTIQGVRRLTRALRPLYLEDLGLVAALEMLARETERSGDLQVTFWQTGPSKRLFPEAELALYRIAQEALSNVIRHARARQVELTLRFEPRQVVLVVQDDGRGFEPPDSPAEFALGGHFGLLGIHERAELMGARLEIQSAPGKGTRLIVTLPSSGAAV